MKRLVIATFGAVALAACGVTFLMAASEPVNAAVMQKQTATFSISNMTCPTCPITVKAAMRKVPGVQSVDVSLRQKIAVVVFDPARVKPAAIAAASTGAGFPATLVR
jgi:mercuric ion binding protein